ncbi:MAG TPA: M23 family metallopeptidase [Cytophagaceae bacterium]|jgi:murein DD-endopeptidase MepM/ murein hydrolase activator NlpD|nr:M23 family metallopeptidase [Cytophagaceae bacterium]
METHKHSFLLLLLATVGIVLLCCNSTTVKEKIFKSSPHEKYLRSLRRAGSKEKALAAAWEEAGRQVFHDSTMLLLPYTETGFFDDAEPQARGYQFHLHAGQIVEVSGTVKTEQGAALFANLFAWEDNKWKEVAFADSGIVLHYETNRDRLCLLRLQPELLSDVWYTLLIHIQPALINPVKGATNNSIGSFYGNKRDNGARAHEGIDIFAPKGTPVVAPTNGIIYNVGTNALGGKVIWLYDSKRSQTYYFAHLDSQWVKSSMAIEQGEIIGQVGNTGNAAKTAPHLHFGIYDNGTKDPLYYVQTMHEIHEAKLDTSFRNRIAKVSTKQSSFHAAPSEHSAVLRIEQKDTYVKLLSETSSWYRVLLPDMQQAYVHRREIEIVKNGSMITLKHNDTLWSSPLPNHLPITTLHASEKLEQLAQYHSYEYVKTSGNYAGWIKR